MNQKDFIKLCKEEIVKFVNNVLCKKHNTDYDIKITEDDVYTVWCCEAFQINKALFNTTLIYGMYYECTYNGKFSELYIDVYKRLDNFIVKK